MSQKKERQDYGVFAEIMSEYSIKEAGQASWFLPHSTVDNITLLSFDNHWGNAILNTKCRSSP